MKPTQKPLPPITVWEYYSAPDELQKLSRNGGDEDWIAEIPPEFKKKYVSWTESGGSFGCCCVDEYDHPTKPGWIIRIGCHA